MGSRTSNREANGFVYNDGTLHSTPPKPASVPPLGSSVAAASISRLVPEFVEDLPSSPVDMEFFTLPELQARMRIDDPKNIRNATIHKGCPHFKLGRTPCFNRELFVEWTKEISIRTTPVTVLSPPTPKQIVGADPAAKV